MAQAGNLGNTIGTPLMVLALGLGSFSGLMAVLLVLFLGGFLAHVLLAQRRRSMLA
jgi:hypothetical protein